MNNTKSYSVKDAEKVSSNSLWLGTFIYMWTNKKPHFILGLIFLMISILLIIVLVAIQLNYIYSFNYAIVIDAGSTGTRAYLYEWLDEAGVINDEVNETAVCKTDKLQNVIPNATEKLLFCVSSLLDHIKTSIILKPRIYLVATAGMRLYEIEFPDHTKFIFQYIKEKFAAKGWNPVYSGIISGEEEAISAWITTNFLKKTIGKFQPKEHPNTFGALDLGGASTQIAYETSSSTNVLEIFQKSYPLYSKSYLCYGSNMFYMRYYTYVFMSNKYTAFHCILKNGVAKPKNICKTCQVEGFNDTVNTVKPIEPDSWKCRQQINDTLTGYIEKINVDQTKKFIAVSSYFYYRTFLKQNYNITNSLASFIDGTDKFCLEDYNQLAIKYPKTWKYYSKYCFVGNYIINLLHYYGFNDISFNNIEFTETINQINVGWSLGFIIDKTRSIPDSIIYRLNTWIFILFVGLAALCVFVILFLYLFVVWERRQKVSDISA